MDVYEGGRGLSREAEGSPFRLDKSGQVRAKIKWDSLEE